MMKKLIELYPKTDWKQEWKLSLTLPVQLHILRMIYAKMIENNPFTARDLNQPELLKLKLSQSGIIHFSELCNNLWFVLEKIELKDSSISIEVINAIAESLKTNNTIQSLNFTCMLLLLVL